MIVGALPSAKWLSWKNIISARKFAISVSVTRLKTGDKA